MQAIYTIELAGHLDRRWASALGGLRVSHQIGPEQRPITVLRGPLADQAALYGLLNQLRDLGATLISLRAEGPG
ncbi:hypothetical protein K2Z83_15785 [Oscillochloris sp. ZM17-4]|uniref:hypothetical protein n=1 Tax=Oscillochloris sp. ZM17-4 TaxID=2866714 RepID=UPI001C73CA45|nr:hypothetical protein [Oscillochloris sp. ZM17-4]MBX0329135.1 hypothetical protein [Oscillochloris sp. ZM17-4]